MNDIDDMIDVLSDPRRRRVLSLLIECERPVSEYELAERVAAAKHDVSPEEVTDPQRDAVRIDFHHVLLPKLADDGWIERRAGDDTVALAKPRRTIALLAKLDDVPQRELAAIGDERRRDVVSVLSSREDSMETRALARALAAGDEGREDVPDACVSRIALSLSHNHLPKLADGGVVSFDSTTNTVAYSGSPTLEGWIDLIETVIAADASSASERGGALASNHS